MQKPERMQWKIFINAPRERVFETALNKDGFRRWSSVFAEGSQYEGVWAQGEEIRFTAPGHEVDSGMVSRIAAHRPPEFTSIKHIGVFRGDSGEPLPGDWYENYTLTEKDGGTEFVAEMDVAEEWKADIAAKWPLALQKLKEICE